MTDKNNPRELFGWKMYDWANSAFYTTVVGALFGPYLTRLAQASVGENGVVLDLGPLGAVTAKSLPSLCASVSVGAQVFLLPVLGALGDYSDLKKRLMMLFCYIAVAANCLLFFTAGGLYLWGGLLFIIANVCFGASNVFYNAYLPEIATEDQTDKVSSRGFAYGYLGGALLLVLNLLLVMRAEQVGISTEMAVRLSLLSAGVWWGGFALISFALLKPKIRKTDGFTSKNCSSSSSMTPWTVASKRARCFSSDSRNCSSDFLRSMARAVCSAMKLRICFSVSPKAVGLW